MISSGHTSGDRFVADVASWAKDGIWNDWNHALDPGYADMACSVDYITSHDMADAPRLMNVILGPML